MKAAVDSSRQVELQTSQVVARPLLKWAGGKTQLLPHLLPAIPDRYGKYIEPFLGGGALFFRVAPTTAVLSDINPELINFYTQISCDPDGVIQALRSYVNTAECFYATRALDWEELAPADAAARTLYLNKTCYNGLYRVNRLGQFNTPYGRYKNPRFCDEEGIRAASRVLSHTRIVCADFEAVLRESAEPGDFIFIHTCNKPVFGLFLSVRVDPNTLETFRHGVWYFSEDQRTRLNIVPLSLAEFKQFFSKLMQKTSDRAELVRDFLTCCSSEPLRDDHDAIAWHARIRTRLERPELNS